MAKQTKLEWNDYGVYGLPTPRQAVENGCVSKLQLSWLHSVVFLTRDATKAEVGWWTFSVGCPSERGDNDFDVGNSEKVRRAFLRVYASYCRRVRLGEVFTCPGKVVADVYVSVERVKQAHVDVGNGATPRTKEVGDKALERIKAALLGQD